MSELLGNISVEDLEKVKLIMALLSTKTEERSISLDQFSTEYLDFVKKSYSHSYYLSVKVSFEYLEKYFSKQMNIARISFKEIEDFVFFIQKKVKKGYPVYYRNLRAAFSKAREWGYLKENLFRKIKLPKKQKNAPTFINEEQLRIICLKIKSSVVKNVVLFSFYTGMRLDEVLNCKWANIDFTSQVIICGDDEFTTKGKKQRFIPINDHLLEIITEIKNQLEPQHLKIYCIKEKSKSLTANKFVFGKKDGSIYTGDYISQTFKKACKAAGIDERVHFHTLRHSFASLLAQKGVSLYIIKELLGHSSISTTEIYAHLNLETLRKAIEK